MTLGLAAWRLAMLLAWQDIRQRYQRSTMGPFWITISMAIVIGSIAFIFGAIFESPVREFLPFLTVGIIIWTFIQTTLTEGCSSFISAEAIIKQVPVPLFVHVERVVFRNLFILVHNAIILPFIFILLRQDVGMALLFAPIGLLCLLLCIVPIALICAVLCTRFRDVAQIIGNALQIIFYVTPIIWLPSLLREKHEGWVLDINPFYHFIELIREPLLGRMPAALSWIVVLFAIFFAWLGALALFNLYRRKIAYWL